MNIPDEYAIPGLGAIVTVISGVFVWFFNENRQRINALEKEIELIKTHLSAQELLIHESRIRRQSDVDVMNSLNRQMESLSMLITDLRIEIQNKKPKD